MRAPIVPAMLLLAAWGCSAPASGSRESNEPTASVQLALTGVDGEAQRYRLRNAAFAINGSTFDPPYQSINTAISSEDDLENDFLTTRLLPGSYTISLTNADWYLERLHEDGSAERVEKAVLLSSPSVSFFASQGSTAQVYFLFGADGDLIDFRHGDLQIGISVQRPTQEGAAGTSPTMP